MMRNLSDPDVNKIVQGNPIDTLGLAQIFHEASVNTA
jgi:hypothetical protein